MPDARKHALAIYEKICATSAERPFAFQSPEQMYRDIAAWQANNPALSDLRQAPPEVHIEFLSHSVEWLKAESREQSNFRVTSTLVDAILYSLQAAPKPLPAELVLKLLTELRSSAVMQFHFPLYQFLSVLTRDQITDEIRVELRKLHLQYAPSPTGKMDKRTEQMRNRLAELIFLEGQKELDRGRGPWTQIVFQEIAAKDDITRSAWQGLLEHCVALEQAVPGAKWRKRSHELIQALGEAEVFATLERWLTLGPLRGSWRKLVRPLKILLIKKALFGS